MKKESASPYVRNLPLALKTPAMTETVCDRLEVAPGIPDELKGTQDHYMKTLGALNRLHRMGAVKKERAWTGKRWGILWTL